MTLPTTSVSDPVAPLEGLFNGLSAAGNIDIAALDTRLDAIEAGTSRGTSADYVVASLALLDAITTAVIGDSAYVTTPGTGIESLRFEAFAGAGSGLDWHIVETVRAATKANLDTFVAAVAAIADTRFSIGAKAYVIATSIDYKFTSAAGAYVVIGPVIRFKGTITTAKTVITSQYWGKSSGSVTFNSTDDPSTGFSTTTGLYTIPATGAGGYLIIASLKADGSGPGSAGITFHKNGTKVAQSPNPPSAAFQGVTFTYYMVLAAGDTVGMQATSGFATVADSADNNFFEIVQVTY